MSGNPWKRPHRTAQQRPKDRLKGSQIAPLAHGRVKCGNCDHPPGLHDETHGCMAQPFVEGSRVCDCTEYVEVNG